LLRWGTFDKFKPGLLDVGSRRWLTKDLTALCIFVSQGKCKSFAELKECYDLYKKNIYGY